MAIGFIATNITATKVVPDKSLTQSSSPKILRSDFGDGYSQRVVDGINSITETYSLSFTNRTKAEADDIIAFFNSTKGVTSFEFTYPDTNSTSTATAVTASSVSSSTSIVLTNVPGNNLNISPNASITGTGVTTGPAPTVESISGTALVVNTAQNINGGVTLTFTNPNERTIKVIASNWNLLFNNANHYSVTTSLERVYEP